MIRKGNTRKRRIGVGFVNRNLRYSNQLIKWINFISHICLFKASGRFTLICLSTRNLHVDRDLNINWNSLCVVNSCLWYTTFCVNRQLLGKLKVSNGSVALSFLQQVTFHWIVKLQFMIGICSKIIFKFYTKKLWHEN